MVRQEILEKLMPINEEEKNLISGATLKEVCIWTAIMS